jgi:hypothetical protein
MTSVKKYKNSKPEFATCSFNRSEIINYASLLMNFRRIKTMAITSNTCIIPPAAYPKNPTAQMIIKITAMA